jgi:hypothetical protein
MKKELFFEDETTQLAGNLEQEIARIGRHLTGNDPENALLS